MMDIVNVYAKVQYNNTVLACHMLYGVVHFDRNGTISILKTMPAYFTSTFGSWASGLTLSLMTYYRP